MHKLIEMSLKVTKILFAFIMGVWTVMAVSLAFGFFLQPLVLMFISKSSIVLILDFMLYIGCLYLSFATLKYYLFSWTLHRAWDTGFAFGLLVVILSIFLASSSGRSGDGRDAAIMSSLHSARAQAELYYDTTGSFKGYCEGVDFMQFESHIISLGSLIRCFESDDAYAIEVSLIGEKGMVYCLDGSGNSLFTPEPSIGPEDLLCGDGTTVIDE